MFQSFSFLSNYLVDKNTQYFFNSNKLLVHFVNKMSTDQFPDVSIVECFDSLFDKYIVKERKIEKKKAKLFEFILKIIEFVRNSF